MLKRRDSLTPKRERVEKRIPVAERPDVVSASLPCICQSFWLHWKKRDIGQQSHIWCLKSKSHQGKGGRDTNQISHLSRGVKGSRSQSNEYNCPIEGLWSNLKYTWTSKRDLRTRLRGVRFSLEGFAAERKCLNSFIVHKLCPALDLWRSYKRSECIRTATDQCGH